MNKNLNEQIAQQLCVDTKEKFLKISKKLHKNLKQSNMGASLSLIQESLSKAFGFRNFNELEKNLALDDISKDATSLVIEKNINKNESNLELLLNSSTPNSLTNMILREYVSNDIWHSRAYALVKMVSNILYKLVLNKDKFKNLDLFRELMVLDNLICIYKYLEMNIKLEKKEPVLIYILASKKIEFSINKDVILEMKNYFLSLPGCMLNKPKQSESTYEQHGFLVMQTIKGLGDLNLITNDICIYHENWENKDNLRKNKSYYALVTDLYQEIKDNRSSFFSKYKTSNNSINLSDIYYLYGTSLEKVQKDKLENALGLIIQNFEILKEFNEEVEKLN